MIKDYCVIFDMDGVIFDSERACQSDGAFVEAGAGCVAGTERAVQVFG